jgi:hypothetical protein
MPATVFTPQPGFSYVPVRPEHVTAVQDFLSALGGEPAPVAVPEEEEDRDINALYSNAVLADIAAGTTKATVIISEIMDVLAQRDGQPANLHDLAKITGRGISQLQTVWTHLSRYLKARYGHKRAPIRSRSGYRFDPPIGGDEVYYWMSPAISTRWRALRGL